MKDRILYFSFGLSDGILPWLLESRVGGSSTETRLAGARVFSSKRDSEIWVDSWVVSHLLLGQKTTESSLLQLYLRQVLLLQLECFSVYCFPTEMRTLLK
ncbi:hypothetical protein LOK49_LG09G01358 [Camellia lanceoleosa]|uniref:Uncharacterized protein n=1 Tax=Camellia lanceoleosa TaxID=1840588 RepID=A0ACC0GH19_9ERIC|nr:hypothetical protein LOK49_LG09G01358 [Camellia lanceoleosa]